MVKSNYGSQQNIQYTFPVTTAFWLSYMPNLGTFKKFDGPALLLIGIVMD